MSFRHLTEAGIRIGEPLSLTLQRVEPDAPNAINIKPRVEGFTGNGFYGSVVMLGDLVVKTAHPDAFHDLLRQINWPVPFPSRYSQTGAKLDYLSGRIISAVIPAATDGQISVPRPEGYARLPGNLGFGQAIERIYGRGPTFLDDGAENENIRQARKKIWETGVEYGLESAAQAHPQNPFGKPNVWLGEKGNAIWLDYLPAFRHTGFVKPFFWYRFHKDVRKAFEVAEPTYNHIHTGLMAEALRSNADKFTWLEQVEIEELMDAYDDVSERHLHEQNKKPQSLFIEEGLARKLITPEQADNFDRHPLGYKLYRAKQLAGLGLQAAMDFADSTPLKLFWRAEPWRNMKRFFRDREYFLESTMLRGLNNARQRDLVSADEYQRTLDIISKKDMKIYTGIQAGYFVTSRLVDVATVPLAVMAVKSSSPAEWGASVAAFNTLSPGVFRAAGTLALAKLIKRNFNKMALFSLIPMVGTYLAVPGQMKRDYGEREASVMHYNLRSLVATISKFRPYGGWGSDLEEKIWNAPKNIASKISKNTAPRN